MKTEIYEMEDGAIVDLFLERDEDALLHTKEKYGKQLNSLSYRICGDTRDAEECENSTYFEAWNSIPPHEPREYLFPFLARITRHLSLNVCKSRERQKRSAIVTELSEELENCIPSPDDTESKLDDIALRSAINGFLSSLSPGARVIFMRRYFFSDSIADICSATGKSETGIKAVLFRCRQKLLSYLQKEGIDL